MKWNIIKIFLRKNKLVINLYYLLKSIVIYPLKFTGFKNIAINTLPLHDLFNFKKISLFNKTIPYTMSDYQRLNYTYNLALKIEKNKIAGAFVECGTWKGGNAAIMAAVTAQFHSGRTTWYFDSFEGMPSPTDKDIAYTKKGEVSAIHHPLFQTEMAKASVSDAEELVFETLKLPREKNIIVKGWFEDTLAKYKTQIGHIAILRLDGDYYQSTLTILNELYEQVVDGGYIIIDDYKGWKGCRRAVHEYLKQHYIVPNFRFMGVYDPKLLPKVPIVYFKKEEPCADESLFRYLESVALKS